jgi:hypothetical protein
MVRKGDRPPVEVVVATGYAAGRGGGGGGGGGGDSGASTSGRERRMFLSGDTQEVRKMWDGRPSSRHPG